MNVKARSWRWGALPSPVLFAVCVLTWSTTWHVITYQIGQAAPELGVAMRFSIAAALVLLGVQLQAWRARRGGQVVAPSAAMSWSDHGLLALQGATMYGFSYAFVYHAEKHLPSGLVAVGYSAAPLLGGLGAWLVFRTPLSWRFLLGGFLGLLGVALIFAPEWRATQAASAQAQAGVALGAMFTAAAVGLSTVGSLAASRNTARGMPFWSALGWGMAYGALAAWGVALVSGVSLAVPVNAVWWASLIYLACAGSVLSFACYLTLLQRLGAGPSGTIGVMTPLLALGVSVLMEGYRPELLAFAGVALAVLGNGLMLRRASSVG